MSRASQKKRGTDTVGMETGEHATNGPENSPEWAVDGVSSGNLDLFIYGNLLPGQSLAACIEPYVLDQQKASVTGTLRLHVSGRFPILIPAKQGRVEGLLVRLKADVAMRVLLMEEEAECGYNICWTKAMIADNVETSCLVCVWPWGADTWGKELGSAYSDIGRFATAEQEQ